jgi:hypothetical protein
LCHGSNERNTCKQQTNNANVKIQGMLKRVAECIFDVCVTNTDTPSYRANDPSKVLEAAEKLKKKNCHQPHIDQ